MARGQACARCQFLEIERVASALTKGLGPGGGVQVGQHGVGFRVRERRRGKLDGLAVAGCGLEGGGELHRHLARAKREREKHGSLRRPPQEMGGELDGGAVRPVQIVEHDDDGAMARHRVEQGADGTVRAVALLGKRRQGRDGGSRNGRKHPGELFEPTTEETLQSIETERAGVVVERIDPDAERDVTLELGAASREDEMPMGTSWQRRSDTAAVSSTLADSRYQPAITRARSGVSGQGQTSAIWVGATNSARPPAPRTAPSAADRARSGPSRGSAAGARPMPRSCNHQNAGTTSGTVR